MESKRLNNNLSNSPNVTTQCAPTPAFSESTDSSSNSIDQIDDEFRQLAIKWILSINKRVEKDTHYVAIAYLNQLADKSICIGEQNYEKLAITVLLLASKMNEIYPPKITSMIARCRATISKQEIIETEGHILQAFGYDISIDSTPYTRINQILGSLHRDKLEDCEKLLRVVAPYRSVYEFGDDILALAVIYLIIPQYIRDMKLNENHQVKLLAINIYNIYTETKRNHQRQKENTRMVE